MDSTESTAPVAAACCALTAAVGLIAVADTVPGAELAGPAIGWAATDSTLTWVVTVAADAAGSPTATGRPSVEDDVATFVAGLELFACAAGVVTPVPPLRGKAEPADGAAERPERLRADGREAGAAVTES